MASKTWISERFVIDSTEQQMVEVFINHDGEVFFGSAELEQPVFFFTLDKDGWERLKEFIDSKIDV